jgi:hypothetical protein
MTHGPDAPDKTSERLLIEALATFVSSQERKLIDVNTSSGTARSCPGPSTMI